MLHSNNRFLAGLETSPFTLALGASECEGQNCFWQFSRGKEADRKPKYGF